MKYVTVKVNGKWKIRMPEHRAARPEWDIKNGGWEKERLNSMYKHLKKGDVVYYIGAELGEMPALCQMWGAEVCLFEPNHSAWPVIKGVWKANKLERPLGLFAAFVGAETKTEPENPDERLKDKWHLGEDNWPEFSKEEINPEHGFSELHKEKDGLPIMSIDDVAMHTKGPTAFSIDVEGSEMEVLKGAENTILTYRPKIWLSLHPEFLIQYWGLYGNDVRNWIKDRGYKEHLLAYDHEVHFFYEPIESEDAKLVRQEIENRK